MSVLEESPARLLAAVLASLVAACAGQGAAQPSPAPEPTGTARDDALEVVVTEGEAVASGECEVRALRDPIRAAGALASGADSDSLPGHGERIRCALPA